MRLAREFRNDRALVVAWLVATLLAGSAPLGAQETSATGGRLEGTWTNVASDGGRAEIERGVEAGIDGLFSLGKPTARSKLRDANPPIPTLRIAVGAEGVRVDLGHGRDTQAAPGAWQSARSATGDAIRIRYTIAQNGALILDSVGDGGTGHHTFRVSEDGRTLRQTVRVESSRLPDDVRYTLTYRRSR